MRSRNIHRCGDLPRDHHARGPGRGCSRRTRNVTIQDNAIEGMVRAAEQPQRLEGASVVLEGGGTRRVAVTGADGRFTFASVSPGEYSLTASVLGRQTTTVDVTVVAGQTARVDVRLDPEPVTLDELIVTGTVMPTAVREVPTPVTIVSRADIERLAPRNVAELVRTAVPGAVYNDEGPGARYGVFSVRGVSGLGGGVHPQGLRRRRGDRRPGVRHQSGPRHHRACRGGFGSAGLDDLRLARDQRSHADLHPARLGRRLAPSTAFGHHGA